MKKMLVTLSLLVLVVLLAKSSYALTPNEEWELRERTRVIEEEKRRNSPEYRKKQWETAGKILEMARKEKMKEDKEKQAALYEEDKVRWLKGGVYHNPGLKKDLRIYMANWAIPEGDFDGPAPYVQMKCFFVSKEIGNENCQLHEEIYVLFDKASKKFVKIRAGKTDYYEDVSNHKPTISEENKDSQWYDVRGNNTEMCNIICQKLPRILLKRRFKEF